MGKCIGFLWNMFNSWLQASYPGLHWLVWGLKLHDLTRIWLLGHAWLNEENDLNQWLRTLTCKWLSVMKIKYFAKWNQHRSSEFTTCTNMQKVTIYLVSFSSTIYVCLTKLNVRPFTFLFLFFCIFNSTHANRVQMKKCYPLVTLNLWFLYAWVYQ